MTYLSLFGVVGRIYHIFWALGDWVLDKWHYQKYLYNLYDDLLISLISTTSIVLSRPAIIRNIMGMVAEAIAKQGLPCFSERRITGNTFAFCH